MIEITDVQVIYNQGKGNEVHALRDVTLSIPRGDFAAVVGPSGSGKSTLMYVMGGLLRPQQGECVVEGQPLTGINARQLAAFRNQKIGFVLQDFGLIPNETVLSNVMTPMLFSKVSVTGMEKRAMRALELMQIDSLAKRKVHQLSGGQSQRVAIARAIVMEPKVILADEPTGALDSDTARHLMEVFLMLNAQGKTILMVTHNTGLCSWCKHTIAIVDGRITSQAS